MENVLAPSRYVFGTLVLSEKKLLQSSYLPQVYVVWRTMSKGLNEWQKKKWMIHSIKVGKMKEYIKSSIFKSWVVQLSIPKHFMSRYNT